MVLFMLSFHAKYLEILISVSSRYCGVDKSNGGVINPELVELGFVQNFGVVNDLLAPLSHAYHETLAVKNATEISPLSLNWLGIFCRGFPDPAFF